MGIRGAEPPEKNCHILGGFTVIFTNFYMHKLLMSSYKYYCKISILFNVTTMYRMKLRGVRGAEPPEKISPYLRVFSVFFEHFYITFDITYLYHSA